MTNKSLDSYDHYVSRTYLRNFLYLPKPEHVFVYRKKEKLEKPMPINSICGERGGDICTRFENPFGLREILAKIEPIWHVFITAVSNKNILSVNLTETTADKITFLEKVSLYIAYLRCLSPTFHELCRKINQKTAKEYNKAIVKWASDFIISSINDSGISKLVDKYRDYEPQVEYQTTQLPGGYKQVLMRHIVKRKIKT